MERVRSLTRYAWGVLAYVVVVIAWGAFVRATSSGAGCGRHWPLCNGEVVPRSPDLAMTIELSHRVTSGIAAFVLLPILLVWTLRVLPRGHCARRWAAWSVAFGLGEALIGAGLVLFELVAHDKSLTRGVSMVLHLENTFLLLASLALTAHHLARAGSEAAEAPAELDAPRLTRGAVIAAMVGFIVLGASGAIAALGDTLFPAQTLREGFAADLSPMAHAFLRLRLLHPLIALGVGALVLGAAGLLRASRPAARRPATALTLLFVLQFGAGLLNVALLAPVWLQLVHLILADATWIALVFCALACGAQKGAIRARGLATAAS